MLWGEFSRVGCFAEEVLLRRSHHLFLQVSVLVYCDSVAFQGAVVMVHNLGRLVFAFSQCKNILEYFIVGKISGKSNTIRSAGRKTSSQMENFEWTDTSEGETDEVILWADFFTVNAPSARN